MLPAAQLEAIAEVARTAVAALLALTATGRGRVRPAELGPLAWLAAFDPDDRAEFFYELLDALSIAESTSRRGSGRDVPARVADDGPGSRRSAARGYLDQPETAALPKLKAARMIPCPGRIARTLPRAVRAARRR